MEDNRQYEEEDKEASKEFIKDDDISDMIEEKFIIKKRHSKSDGVTYVIKGQPYSFTTVLIHASRFNTKEEAYNEINNVCNEGIYQILPIIVKNEKSND